jgi:hypothetical protein
MTGTVAIQIRVPRKTTHPSVSIDARAGSGCSSALMPANNSAIANGVIRFGRGASSTVWDHPPVTRDAVSAEELPAAAAVDWSAGESRWPPALTLLTFLVVNVTVRIWIPSDGVIRVPWLLPAIAAVLIVVLLTNRPDSPAERVRLRQLALVLTGLLVFGALWATGLLLYDIIESKGQANSARDLLATGGLVWVGNNLAFATLYWLLDGGGPIARSQRATPVDFAFTQQMSPELAPARWKPVFLDYLHLGFTNATAFSPTDVMPLTHRAKYAMLAQSTIALALFGLVVARAVNVLQ